MDNPAIKILTSVVFALAIIVGALILVKSGRGVGGDVAHGTNVVIENGTQIVTITAKGGYSPRQSVAKAGLPTVVRFETSGTFDCSSSVIIPSLNIGKQLAFSGATDVDVGTSQAGPLKGSCGMGMYPFEIDFN